jgi:hypothetical protein
MRRSLIIAVIITVTLILIAAPVYAKATRVHQAIWADGKLYGTTVTPAELPNHGKFNALYNFDGSGLEGQRSISEAKPGDKDYRGGRWEVFPVTFTELGMSIHDPDGDGMVNFELTSDTQLLQHEALGHLTIGADPIIRFVCPVIPEK